MRSALRTYTPSEIEAFNAERGRTGVAAFRPAEEVLVDIAAGKKPTRARALAWYYHPDERVQLALLDREDLTPRPGWGGYKNFRLLAVWATAFAQAAREGVVWTPVLDYISSRRRWWPPRHLGERVLDSLEFASHAPWGIELSPAYRTEERQAAALQGWLQSGKRERIDLILRFQSDTFVGYALQWFQELSPARLHEILEKRPSIGPIIGRCRGLSPNVAKGLKGWAFADLHRAERRLAALPESASEQERERLAYGGRTLQNLAAQGAARATDGHVRRLATAFSDREIERLLALLDAGGDPLIGPTASAARVLLACSDRLDEPALLKLLPHLDPRSWDVVVVAESPHATPAVWRACLEFGAHPELRRTIASRPGAVELSELRPLLARSNAPDVLRALATNASNEEFPRLFRKLLRRDLDSAGLLLEQHPDRAVLLLRSDLLPLAESPKQRHRLLAITLMSRASAQESDQQWRRRSR